MSKSVSSYSRHLDYSIHYRRYKHSREIAILKGQAMNEQRVFIVKQYYSKNS